MRHKLRTIPNHNALKLAIQSYILHCKRDTIPDSQAYLEAQGLQATQQDILLVKREIEIELEYGHLF